eukprot:EG_transcript_18638
MASVGIVLVPDGASSPQRALSSSASTVCPPSPRDSGDLPESPSSSALPSEDGEDLLETEPDGEGEEFHDCRAPAGTGGRQPFAIVHKPLHAVEPVYLNVYNLVDVEENLVGRVSGVLGLGLHHCGVELYGREWSFCGTIFPEDRDETGVFWTRPRRAVPHFQEALPMGCTALSEAAVRHLLAHLRAQWPRGAYHILHRNCNHFAELLVRRLLGDQAEVPGWVNRAARVGDFLLPEKLINFFVEAAHARMREDLLAEEPPLTARSEAPAGATPTRPGVPMWPTDEGGMNFLDPRSPTLSPTPGAGLSPVTSNLLL